MKNPKRLYKFLAFLFPAVLCAAFLLKDQLLALTNYFPKCAFHVATGYLCPGCGNTRSVIYLLQGDILSALRCNISVPLLLLLLTALYIEMLFSLAGKTVKLLPRKMSFWMCVLAAFLIYCVLRNFIGFLSPIKGSPSAL